MKKGLYTHTLRGVRAVRNVAEQRIQRAQHDSTRCCLRSAFLAPGIPKSPDPNLPCYRPLPGHHFDIRYARMQITFLSFQALETVIISFRSSFRGISFCHRTVNAVACINMACSGMPTLYRDFLLYFLYSASLRCFVSVPSLCLFRRSVYEP